MKVLVSAASRHGATAQIAEALGNALSQAGFETAVDSAEQVFSVSGFDAVVLGSAVYLGHWLAPARDVGALIARDTTRLPVWLFSSGPLGEPPKPEQEAVEVAPLMAATGARGHRVFGGRLARTQLSFPERAVAAALRVPDRDDRDWGEIGAWADEIALALRHEGSHQEPGEFGQQSGILLTDRRGGSGAGHGRV